MKEINKPPMETKVAVKQIDICNKCYFRSGDKCDSCDQGYPYIRSNHGELIKNVKECQNFLKNNNRRLKC